MPSNWFECLSCGGRILLFYTVSDVGGPDWPPSSDHIGCGCGIPLVLAPAPGDFSIDAKEPFQRFEVYREVTGKDGPQQVIETIDSVHKLRKVEQDSEQRYRDGEGEPLRFRVYNQDRSNMDVNSFGTEGQIGSRSYDSGRAPQAQSNIGVKRHGQKKPRIPLARGGGASPLKGL